jgi:hypothetical protein
MTNRNGGHSNGIVPLCSMESKPVQLLGVMLGNLHGGAGKLAYIWPKTKHSSAKCEFALEGQTLSFNTWTFLGKFQSDLYCYI